MDATEDLRKFAENDSIFSRTGKAAVSSFVGGTIWGAVKATWQDVPAVERNVALPALIKTGRVMGYYGLTFAAIGGVFAVTDAALESVRGKKDFWNSAFGGLAAGSVIGLRLASLQMGIASGAALGVVSALVDTSGQVTRTPIGRDFLPIPTDQD